MKTMDLNILLDGEWQKQDIFTDKNILLVGIPGAYTPACESQLPTFIQQYDTFKQKGIDEVYCISTNDRFVMKAWAEVMGVGNGVKMIADGNAIFTSRNNLFFDLNHLELGIRSKRYAMIIKNGEVVHAGFDDDAYADPVLQHL